MTSSSIMPGSDIAETYDRLAMCSARDSFDVAKDAMSTTNPIMSITPFNMVLTAEEIIDASKGFFFAILL